MGRTILYQVDVVQKCYNNCLLKSQFPHPIRNPISWISPVRDSFKLNCDGAISRLGEVAAVGGILRNQWGKFLLGFSSHLGHYSITEAELRAIHMGAMLIKVRGLLSVEIETDSMDAIKLISEGCSQHHPFFNLISEIRNVLEHHGMWYITHTLHEGNQAAYCFAKFGLSLDSCSKVFNCIPHFASLFVRVDLFGTSFPRGL